MILRKPRAFRSLLLLAIIVATAGVSVAQRVKRIVIVKIDGLPSYFVDEVRRQRDPETGKSKLPWIDEVFYKNGTRLENFYVRGMSLSGPSWGLLDTGQHLQIKGNVEFDRYTLHAYDYLNFLPYYIGYGRNQVVDMPSVEVLDSLKLPLLSDAFPLEKKYTSQQLYQRGFDWAVIGSGFINMIPKERNDLIDEWTLGFEVRKMTIDQTERDIVGKLQKRPEVDYFDYYDTAFDHVSHHNNDTESRINALQQVDRTIGRIWTAIEESSRADETALVLVSDHGFSSSPKVYSQGFNLVRMLASRQGGGHHVITKRRLMLDYSLKGIYPLVPLIRTSSNDSYYLTGQADKYPTALVDFDGNERSSIHLRNSDLNVLHILLSELKKKDVKSPMRDAAADAVLAIVSDHRDRWQRESADLTRELDALHRWIERTRPKLPHLPMSEGNGVTREQARNDRRLRVALEDAERDEKDYRDYLASMARLTSLAKDDLIRGRFEIDELIAPNAMGEANDIGDLQNYVVGLSQRGLTLNGEGKLDMDASFARVDYPAFILSQRVRNNVQEGVSNRPIDFVAMRIPLESVADVLAKDDRPDDDPIWLYAGDDKQVLILTRQGEKGDEMYRYLSVAGLRQDTRGRVTFSKREIAAGLPLHYFEAPELAVAGDRKAWFSEWHSELEWLRAVHRTMYSNAIIGLNEQMDRHPFIDTSAAGDEGLIEKFRERQRLLTEADMLVEASNHWNFDVRGFNPGGNHGSFFRSSTNSTFMIAGGDATGIPRGKVVDEPYDSLSFMPTLLALMGRIDDQNRPTPAMSALGFRPFPGRVVRELVR